MRIAVTSQNITTITPHAGKCRRFWIYETDTGACLDRRFVEVPLEETFHATHDGLPRALRDIEVLISRSMGNGLREYLLRNGVVPIVTDEENPDFAVVSYLNGILNSNSGMNHDCHDHSH